MATARSSRWVGRLAYAADYALAVTAVVSVASAVLGLVVGAPLVAAKYGLFVVGWFAFGYATLLFLPRPPWRGDRPDENRLRESLPSLSEPPSGPDPDASTDEVAGVRRETKFQALVAGLPPASLTSLPASERLSTRTHIGVASVTMLAASFVLETVFGVPG